MICPQASHKRYGLTSLLTAAQIRKRLFDFAFDRETSGRGLGKDHFAVGHDVELSRFTNFDLRVLAEAGLE